MLLALSGLSVAAVAQNTTEVTEEVLEVVEVRQDKYAVVTNPFWDNWFVSFGYGATVLLGDYDAAGSFGKRISPTLNVAVGKWFTPGMGARLQYSGLQARGYVPSAGSDYADAATGTTAYNEKLARQRAEAVINVLVEKYGVDREKLLVGTAEAVDSFGEPILNRVVVVESAR